MDVWSEDSIDQFVQAEIDFEANGLDGIRFIAVEGDLDCRVGERSGHLAVEWSWVGWDDGDDASGRGWCILHDDDTPEGMIGFHLGDDSGFHAVRA